MSVEEVLDDLQVYVYTPWIETCIFSFSVCVTLLTVMQTLNIFLMQVPLFGLFVYLPFFLIALPLHLATVVSLYRHRLPTKFYFKELFYVALESVTKPWFCSSSLIQDISFCNLQTSVDRHLYLETRSEVIATQRAITKSLQDSWVETHLKPKVEMREHQRQLQIELKQAEEETCSKL